jgi:hypothetical protein
LAAAFALPAHRIMCIILWIQNLFEQVEGGWMAA